MIRLEDFSGIYLHRDRVDFRKSINGLSLVVENEMKRNVFEKSLFLFCNKDRTRLKILYWDKTGFALWLKRLEKDKFTWPNKLENSVVEVSTLQLRWLLAGVDVWKIKPHEQLKYSCVS
jgi:transposase